MNRTEALKTLAGGLVATTSLPAQVPDTTSFLKDFLARWHTVLSYSLKVLEKMPEGLYDYRPSPGQMTFGEQFTHAAHWNTFFIGSILDQPPLPEPETADKATTVEYYTTCHKHCTALLEKMNETQLDKTGHGSNAYWQKHTGRDFLLRAFMHVAHHRAQTLVYLRMNGIEPPFFEF